MDKSVMLLNKLCRSRLISSCLSNTVGRLPGLNLFLPMYHTVQATEDLPHIKNLYTPHTVEQFQQDLNQWLKRYEPLSLEDLEEVAAGQKTIKRPSIFLTFDDGLREVYDHALPILTKLGVPSAVFVNSKFVDNRGLFFRYMASLLIDRITNNTYEISDIREALHLVLIRNDDNLSQIDRDGFSVTTDYEQIRTQLLQAIMAIKYEHKERLDEVAQRLGIDVNTYLEHQKPYMTMDQLSLAKSQGMAIGAHSIDHPLYRDLSSADQMKQTQDSIDYVCGEFGEDRASFAFPFSDSGVSKSEMREILSIQKNSIVFAGQGFRSDIDSRIFHRHSMEANDQSVGAILARHHLVGFARKITGRSDVSRRG